MVVNITSELPILIIGGGPGGLALAQNLRKRNIPFRVFERDVDEHARGQGWAVALRWMVPKLRENLLADVPALETCSHLYQQGLPSEIGAFDEKGNKFYGGSQDDIHFIRADRLKLRELLRHEIKVEWNKMFSRYEELEDRVKVVFQDGTEVEGAAVVGADGGKSLVRHQLIPGSDLVLSQLRTIGGQLTVSRAQCEDLWKTLARSVSVVQTEKVFLFIGLHRLSDDGETADWYWQIFVRKTDIDSDVPIDDWSHEKVREQALEWTKGFAQPFRNLIEWSKTENCQPMSSLITVWCPEQAGWTSDRVTLIGDALHKVTPGGGTGVNHAIEDTVKLCEILDANDNIPAAFHEYDHAVTERAQGAIERSTSWPIVRPDGQ